MLLLLLMLLIVCFMSQQHAGVPDGRICWDNCTCCHKVIEVFKLAVSPTQSLLTLGQPVLSLTLLRQAPGRIVKNIQIFRLLLYSSSFSRSSHGNSSLLNEGGNALQVPQATIELAGSGSVVWPYSRILLGHLHGDICIFVYSPRCTGLDSLHSSLHPWEQQLSTSLDPGQPYPRLQDW